MRQLFGPWKIQKSEVYKAKTITGTGKFLFLYTETFEKTSAYVLCDGRTLNVDLCIYICVKYKVTEILNAQNNNNFDDHYMIYILGLWLVWKRTRFYQSN